MDGPGPMGPTRMRLGKPVIAAIEGPAVAGGLELALWCDLRVAAADAMLGVYCRRFGRAARRPRHVRLPRLIGHSRAIDLILTGRGVDGVEADGSASSTAWSRPGEALAAAVRSPTSWPRCRSCLRNDRLSALEQWDLAEDEAMRNEAVRGRATIDSGETRAGAARFAAGAGRHGTTARALIVGQPSPSGSPAGRLGGMAVSPGSRHRRRARRVPALLRP